MRLKGAPLPTDVVHSMPRSAFVYCMPVVPSVSMRAFATFNTHAFSVLKSNNEQIHLLLNQQSEFIVRKHFRQEWSTLSLSLTPTLTLFSHDYYVY